MSLSLNLAYLRWNRTSRVVPPNQAPRKKVATQTRPVAPKVASRVEMSPAPSSKKTLASAVAVTATLASPALASTLGGVVMGASALLGIGVVVYVVVYYGCKWAFDL